MEDPPVDRPWEVLPICFWNNFEAGFLRSDQNLFVTFQKNRRLVNRDPQNGLLKPYNLYITVYSKSPLFDFQPTKGFDHCLSESTLFEIISVALEFNVS